MEAVTSLSGISRDINLIEGISIRKCNSIRLIFLILSAMGESFSKVESLVSDKLKELRVKAEELFNLSVEPETAYDLKGQAAGQANYRKNRLRFNRDLLEKYTHEFVHQTVPHEFAHLVAYRKFGTKIKPHGMEWKSVMLAFGVEPTRTHGFKAVSSRRLKRFAYRCACPDSAYELTSIRHNRVQRGGLYLCKKCQSPLQQDLKEFDRSY